MPFSSLRFRSTRFDDGRLNQKVKITTIKIIVHLDKPENFWKFHAKNRKTLLFINSDYLTSVFFNTEKVKNFSSQNVSIVLPSY